MGIPRLKTHLQPYATFKSAHHGTSEKVVLDGPAMAYHVYYNWLATPAMASWLSPAQHVGRLVLQWLDRMERCGLIMYVRVREALFYPSSLLLK